MEGTLGSDVTLNSIGSLTMFDAPIMASINFRRNSDPFKKKPFFGGGGRVNS